jgi:predicted acetyltransferase
VLRVDKYFRTHGPAVEKQIYTRRSVVERVNSRQKELLCLEKHRARGLERVTVHALLCMVAILLNAVASLRLKRPEKARCITMLAR